MNRGFGKPFLFAIVLLIVSSMLITACTKNSTSAGSGPNSLWPLKVGNVWRYSDSLFNDTTGFVRTYADSITLTGAFYTDPSGVVFAGINNPLGWFGTGSFIAVDPDNTTIYESDSVSGLSPYVFFGTTYQDNVLIGTGNDFSNVTCPSTFSQYGFVSTTNINGYTCLKNVEYTTNCNNINTAAVVTYVSPGVGVVRMEDYVADSTRHDSLYMDFSQTLQSVNLK